MQKYFFAARVKYFFKKKLFQAAGHCTKPVLVFVQPRRLAIHYLVARSNCFPAFLVNEYVQCIFIHQESGETIAASFEHHSFLGFSTVYKWTVQYCAILRSQHSPEAQFPHPAVQV